MTATFPVTVPMIISPVNVPAMPWSRLSSCPQRARHRNRLLELNQMVQKGKKILEFRAPVLI